MLKGPGSNHLCILRSFVQVLFSWGGWWSYSGRKEISHNIFEYVKFPTNCTFHGNFPISTWENFSGNLTCMLEWNCYLTSIHGNHTFHLRKCSCTSSFLYRLAFVNKKSLLTLIYTRDTQLSNECRQTFLWQSVYLRTLPKNCPNLSSAPCIF